MMPTVPKWLRLSQILWVGCSNFQLSLPIRSELPRYLASPKIAVGGPFFANVFVRKVHISTFLQRFNFSSLSLFLSLLSLSRSVNLGVTSPSIHYSYNR